MKHLILIVVTMLFISHLHALEKSFELRTVERIDTTEVMNYLHDGGNSNKCIILRKSHASSIKLRPLNLAAQENDGFLAQLALEKGAAIDYRDQWDYTALSIAAKKGYSDMVRLLIKHGASVNLTDSQNEYVLALKDAIGNHQINIVKLLIENGVTVNAITPGAWSPLHMVCCKGLESIATLLIDKGANVDYRPNNGERPLTVAIDRGHTAISIELIKRGAEVEYEIIHERNITFTPLELACCKEDREIVKALIAKKANVNIVNKYENRTPLHIAVDASIISLLIQAGANVNAQDINDKTPLHHKVHMGHFNAVKILLANKADVNIKNKNGYTPLYNAATSSCIARDRRHEMIDLLLNAGAKVEFGDFEQKTLLNGSMTDDSITLKLFKNGLKPTAGFLELLDKTIHDWEGYLKFPSFAVEHYQKRLIDLQAIKELCEKK